MLLNDLILRLYDIEAITFNEFILKNDVRSPFNIDLCLIQSYPLLLKAISEAMWKKIQFIDFEVLCGIPYNAVPFATTISVFHNIPMIIRRKKNKNHEESGIEGVFKPGQRCIIVDDLITTGLKLIETTEVLKYEGLIVKDVVVLIDCEQGGAQALEERKINFHSLFSISDIVNVLVENQVMTKEQISIARNFSRDLSPI